MTQEALSRVHVALGSDTFKLFTKLALASSVEKKITVGALVAAAVFCLIEKMEAALKGDKHKTITVNGVKISTKEKEDLKDFVRLQGYFGKTSDLMNRVKALSDSSGMSVGWIVRQACRACAPVFEKSVPKGKSFKCLGKLVTID